MESFAEPLVADQAVPHFLDYVDAELPEVKVVIPSFDRPEQLCKTTLPLIQQNSIPLEKVAVFVAPGHAPGRTAPEWQRYLDALRRFGLTEVRLLEGGRGLVANMNAALEWVGSGYFITMSDSVTDVQQVFQDGRGLPKLRPLPKRGLHAIICHGRALMAAGSFVAWGLSPSHSARCLKEDQLSRKLGLLDGNLSGCVLPCDWRDMTVHPARGLIYDVEWTANLWARGYRFVRFSGLCARHEYRRPGGQASLYQDVLERRQQENAAIRGLAAERSLEVRFTEKPTATLKTMQYSFRAKGPGPLCMAPPSENPCGRKRKEFLDRPMSPAERKQKQRGGKVPARRSQ